MTNVRGGAITYGVAITVAQRDCATINPATSHQRHHMPHQQNKKAVRFDSHEEKVIKAIKELKENSGSQLKHVAAYYGPNSKTLFNRYYGCTQDVRDAHPESRELAPLDEQYVAEWVEKRDIFVFRPKHKELTRMVVSMLNSKGQRCGRLGD